MVKCDSLHVHIEEFLEMFDVNITRDDSGH